MHYEKTVLDSGIRVLTERMPEVESVTLGIWIDAGSRDELLELSGITHFLEHLLFKGTDSRTARDIAEDFDLFGGDINAVTGKEHTCIYFRVVNDYLPQAMKVACDIVLQPTLRAGDVESESKVVVEEILLHQDSPEELVHDLLGSSIWPRDGLGLSVLGDAEIISSLSPDTISEYHRQHYVPDRMVVAAAGKVNHSEICDLLDLYAHPENGADSPGVARKGLPVRGGRNMLHKDTEQAHICLGAPGIPRQDPRRFALTIMDNILGGGMSSRLFQRVRENLGLAYSVFSYHSMLIGCGMTGIYCGTHPSRAAKVISVIREEVDRLVDGGITDDELRRSKSHLKGSLLINAEASANRMNRLAKVELAGGDHLALDELTEKLEMVTTEDVIAVARDTWGQRARALAVIGPFDDNFLDLTG